MALEDSAATHCNALILLAGVALAAITVPTPGVAAAIGGMLSFAWGVAGSHSAKWLGDTLDDLPPDQAKLFRNHQLRTLIAQAAAQVVARIIGKNPASLSGTLASAEKEIGAALDRALGDPDSPFAALHEFKLPDILTEFATSEGKVELLTPEIWEQLLFTLPTQLWPGERTALAAALHTDFAAVLWQLTKRDAARDGQAFAATELLFLSRLLKATEGMAGRPDPSPILGRIESRISELDEKQTALLRQVLQGNARIVEKLDTVIAAAPLQSYYRALREQFSTYENIGLPVLERDGSEGEKDRAIPIRELFVAPTCTEAPWSPEAFDTALREGKNPTAPLLPVLALAGRRTVLLADPGMGKSTLIQWLIATLADEKPPAGAGDLRHAIPRPFILRDLVAALPAEVKLWDWDALVAAFRGWHPRSRELPALAAPLTREEDIFRTILGSERAFFLIDGLDEIGDPVRRLAIRDALWEGFEKYPEARWLITSRIVGYEQAEVHREMKRFAAVDAPHGPELMPLREYRARADYSIEREEFETVDGYASEQTHALLLHLAPFDDAQQLRFAQNWYRPRMDHALGTQRAADFIAAVQLHAHTRAISRVPNLLYLLALLYRHEAHLPDGRALVYDAISRAYLETIASARRLSEVLAVPYTFAQKEEFLATIAMHMQAQRAAQAAKENGEILVTRAQIEAWLGPHFGGADDPAACAELHHFLEHIANRSGLLLPRGEGLFGFAHLSFQEYYAACQLRNDFRRILNAKAQGTAPSLFRKPAATAPSDEERIFAEMAALPAWHEPLLFLVEKLRESPDDTATILEWAFPQLTACPKKGKALLPLAAAQLLAALSRDQEVALPIKQRRELWRILWQAHLAMQWDDFSLRSAWHLAPALLTASTYQEEILRILTALQPAKLDLSGCAGVSDLSALSGLGSLAWLDLGGCAGVSDLSALRGLGSLATLSLYGCAGVSEGEVATLKKARPKLKIYDP